MIEQRYLNLKELMVYLGFKKEESALSFIKRHRINFLRDGHKYFIDRYGVDSVISKPNDDLQKSVEKILEGIV